MIVSLFETGYLADGAGLFQADPGHLEVGGMTTRLADAMRRGAQLDGSHDFLELDWFDLADRPVGVVRRELRVTDKQMPPGVFSPGPWETGGITPFQLDSARARAVKIGRDPATQWRPDPDRS